MGNRNMGMWEQVHHIFSARVFGVPSISSAMLADLLFQLHTEEGQIQRQWLFGSSSKIEQCLALSPSHQCFLIG
jgi:hypothetical protein